MLEKVTDEFEQLYKQWCEEEWAEDDPLKFVRIARRLTQLQPMNVRAWDALATSIMGVLFPPGQELTDEEKASLKDNPLFWEMADAFGKEMELDPDEPSAPWNRAISFNKAGLYKHAYEDFLRVAKIEKKHLPEDEPFAVSIDLLNAGRAIYDYGDYNKAVETIKTAIAEGGEEDGDIWYHLALAFEKQGKISEALEAYSKAALLDPEKYEEDLMDAKRRYNTSMSDD